MLTPLAYVTCALIWGTTWFGIRRCIGPGGYPTFAAAALRFAIAGAILLAVRALGWGRPGPRSPRQVGALVLCGALSAIGYALVYAGEQSISGGLAAVIYGMFPLCTALIATIGRVEAIPRRALAGSTLALAGIGLVFADRLEVSRAQGAGVLLVLASVFVSALYSTILKRVASDVHPLASTGIFLGTAAFSLAAAAPLLEHRSLPWPPPLGPTVALVYLAVVGSVLVFLAYFVLLKRVTLMTLSTLALVEPVVALTVDAIGERDVVLSPRSYAGVAVTIGGVALSILGGGTQKAPVVPSDGAGS
jgi:drug/metabolite transporter (DMT)-like permease